jgi:hypothetical protein
MPIERVIGGVIYEFPDGTSEATIRKFEAQKTGGAAAPSAAPAQPSASRPRPFSTGAGSQFLQGLTFGFSDEAIAGLRSAMGQGKYEDLVKAEREALRKYGEQHPVIGTTAEIVGGIAPAVVTGGASLIPGLGRTLASTVGPRAAQLLLGTQPTIGRMAATGAGAGAATAVGTSEKSLMEQPAEAAKGAVAGAAVTGTLGVAGKYVMAPAFRRVKQAMGFGDANKAADIAIARALEKDGLTPDQAAAKIAAVQRGEMTLADLGENTAALLRHASAAPGEARRVTKAELAGREMERVPRVTEDLRTLMSGSKDFYTDIQDLIKKRSKDANALYDAAYSAAPSFSAQTAPDIARLRNLPSFQEAMKKGAKRMADLDLDIADPKNTLRALHETKIALDDMIDTAVRAGEGNQARTLISMKNRLLKDMESASPEYKIARQTYAGDMEMQTAMQEGQRVYQLPELEMRKLIDRFKDSPSEYDAFRAGIAQSMLDRLRAGGPSADPVKTVFPRGVEDKLRRAFRDDEAFDAFKTRLAEEQTMLGTEKAAFRRTPLDTDLDQGAGGVGAATSLLAGRPMTAGMEALRARFPNVVGMPPAIATPTAQKLLAPANKTDEVLGSIMQSLKQQEQELLAATGAVGAGSALMGGLAAARPVQQQYPEESLNQPGLPPMPSGASPLGSLKP